MPAIGAEVPAGVARDVQHDVGSDADEDDEANPAQGYRDFRKMTKKDILKAEKKRLKADHRAYLEAEREAKEERRLRREEAQRERDAIKEAVEIKKQMERELLREKEKQAEDRVTVKEAFEWRCLDQESVGQLAVLRNKLVQFLRKKKVPFVILSKFLHTLTSLMHSRYLLKKLLLNLIFVSRIARKLSLNVREVVC